MVEAEVTALTRAGHTVLLLAQHTDARATRRLYPLEAAATVATGIGSSPRAAIARFSPDVVHVHNLFPNFGTRWVGGLSAPMVATLHNYRSTCAAGTLYRDGHVCTDCFSGPRPGVIHGCYHSSRLATLPLALGQLRESAVLKHSKRVIVLSPTQRGYFQRAGFDSARIVEVPNFVPDHLAAHPGPGGDSWVYAGRLTEEKGVADIVRAWPSEIPLRIVGNGPLFDQLLDLASGKNVEMLGSRSRAEVVNLMRHSRGLAFASRWPDPFGLVYAESLAAGTPVLAVGTGAPTAMVVRDGTGTTTTGLDPMTIRHAHESFPSMRARCRQVFENRYTETAHMQVLTDVYEQAMRGL
jgi:glycosyltransferase involved in cell wall biosynthesis